MSTSIYNVTPYAGATTFSQWDVTSIDYDWNNLGLTGTSYLYCTVPGLGSSSTPSTTAWDGYQIFQGEIKPKFLWVPSYGQNSMQQPKVLRVAFGDSYESRMADGLSNDLLSLDLVFENRGIDETVAILHFLTQRNGTESFVYLPQPPYSTNKRFISESWRETQTFYGNYSISANFKEVVN